MQRVALARVLVKRPQVLLLDEPLSALDLAIRLEMEAELRRVHRETGATFVYVTHDQREAMALSDRIVVLNQGRIEQVGAPETVYRAPASAFAARFVGDANVIAVEVVQAAGSHTVIAIGEHRMRRLPRRRRRGPGLARAAPRNRLRQRGGGRPVAPRRGPRLRLSRHRLRLSHRAIRRRRVHQGRGHRRRRCPVRRRRRGEHLLGRKSLLVAQAAAARRRSLTANRTDRIPGRGSVVSDEEMTPGARIAAKQLVADPASQCAGARPVTRSRGDAKFELQTSSKAMRALRQAWTMVAGQSGVKAASHSSRSAAACLCAPFSTMTTDVESRAIVPSPTDTPCVGTAASSSNAGKVARLSRRVVSARRTTRDPLSIAVPGGLKPT